MKSQAAARQTDERPFMEELERRLLMSADVFGAFASNAVFQDVEQPESDSASLTESDQAVAAEAAEHQSRELIIIDAATPDYESLLADLTGNAEEDRLFEVAILDPTEDGVARSATCCRSTPASTRSTSSRTAARAASRSAAACSTTTR